ncbi:DUF1761 family protein [Pseudokineococcus basanitobsidens]|uniref:DUF1761 family protein n=1 Tax=Pseudokineococcus basanitobsidens TaxID=1926649 RepID=A0ABU8RFU9_9ACTN
MILSSLDQISWLGVLVSVVVFAGLGALYFMVLVPRQYLAALGRQDAPPAPRRTVDAVGPLVTTVLLVLTSAVLVAALDLQTVTDAVVFGVLVGVGYLVSMTFTIAINPNFPHPIRYGLLNTPYFLLGSVITAVLLVVL